MRIENKENIIFISSSLASLGLITLALTTAFSKMQRRRWFVKEFNAQCQECGRKWDYDEEDGGFWMLEYDHIIPESKGGADTLENSNLLCQECHYQKHLDAEEYYAAQLILDRLEKTGGRNIHYKERMAAD